MQQAKKKLFFLGHVWQNHIFVQNKIVKTGLMTCLPNTPLR
jgi:hypothetical protein